MKGRPYPSYKPSDVQWLGAIPSGWDVEPLKRVTRMQYGDALASDVRQDGTFPVYGSNGPVGTHCSANTLSPTLIVGRKGSFGRVSYSDSAAFCIDTAYYIDGRHTRSNLRWLYYVLDAAQLDDVSQDTGVPGLSREAAYEKRICVPPSSEQELIAAFLDRETAKLDTLIGKQEHLIELLEEKRQAVISRAVTKGLNPNAPTKDSGVEWLGQIPSHWGLTRLKFAASHVVDCPHETPRYDEDGDYIVIRTADVNQGVLLKDNAYRLREDEFLRRTRRMRLECNDIVYGREGERWGHAALIPEGAVFCLGQRMMQFRVSSRTIPTFMMWQLNSLPTYRQGEQDTVGATSPHVNVETIKNFWLAEPPVEEQREIAQYVDVRASQFDMLISKSRRSIELMREHRSALISAAVTGKIDVRDEAAVAASEQLVTA